MASVAQRYLREVRSLLPCTVREKKRLLGELKGDVSAYLEEKPNATLEDLCSAFSSPQAMAGSLLAGATPADLMHKMSAKRRIGVAAVGIVSVLAIFFGVVAAYLTWSTKKIDDGFVIVTIVTTADEECTVPDLGLGFDVDLNPEPLEIH